VHSSMKLISFPLVRFISMYAFKGLKVCVNVKELTSCVSCVWSIPISANPISILLGYHRSTDHHLYSAFLKSLPSVVDICRGGILEGIIIPSELVMVNKVCSCDGSGYNRGVHR